MDLLQNNSSSRTTDSIIHSTIGNDDNISTDMVVIAGIPDGTISRGETVVPNQINDETNKDKPWREVIKRRFIDG